MGESYDPTVVLFWEASKQGPSRLSLACARVSPSESFVERVGEEQDDGREERNRPPRGRRVCLVEQIRDGRDPQEQGEQRDFHDNRDDDEPVRANRHSPYRL